MIDLWIAIVGGFLMALPGIIVGIVAYRKSGAEILQLKAQAKKLKEETSAQIDNQAAQTSKTFAEATDLMGKQFVDCQKEVIQLRSELVDVKKELADALVLAKERDLGIKLLIKQLKRLNITPDWTPE